MSATTSVVECGLIRAEYRQEHDPATMTESDTNSIPESPVPKFRPLVRMSVRFFAALLGLSLLGYLVFRTGPGIVWRQLQTIGWGLAVVIILGGFSQLVKTCAWRQAFTCDISRVSWLRSFATQLISDAIGQFGIAGKVLGEGTRISLLGRAVPLPNALSAGAIDGALHTFTAVLITVSGLIATLLLTSLPGSWRVYAWTLVTLLLLSVILAAVAVVGRWRLMGNTSRAIGRLPLLQKWVRSKQPIIDSAERNLLTFHQEALSAFWANLILNLLCHVLAVLEVYLIVHFMGLKILPVRAFVLESLTKVINLVGAFNPGNLGTYEVGNMLIAKMFGVSATAGLTLALCRRARTIFWAGVGALCTVVMRKAEPPEDARPESRTRAVSL